MRDVKWNDLTIGQYERICSIFKEDIDDEEKMIGVVTVVYGITEDEVMRQPLTKTREMIASVEGLKTSPDDVRTKKRYRLKGKLYNVCVDADKITTAQYIDYQTYSKDLESNIAEILSVVLIPRGKRYGEGYDVAKLIGDIRESFPLGDALSIAKVFRYRWLKSIRRSLLCSEALMMGQKTLMGKGQTTEEMERAITAVRSMRSEVEKMTRHLI